MVVADDFLDARRGNDDPVNTPDSAVFEVGRGKYGTARREVPREGEWISLVVGQPGVVSVTGYQGTEARKGIGGGVRGAGDVLEVNVERFHIGNHANHSRRGWERSSSGEARWCPCVQ